MLKNEKLAEENAQPKLQFHSLYLAKIFEFRLLKTSFAMVHNFWDQVVNTTETSNHLKVIIITCFARKH